VPACSTSIHITILPSLKTRKHDQTVKKICHAICLFHAHDSICDPKFVSHLVTMSHKFFWFFIFCFTLSIPTSTVRKTECISNATQ
jgi:hypothetical protein